MFDPMRDFIQVIDGVPVGYASADSVIAKYDDTFFEATVTFHQSTTGECVMAPVDSPLPTGYSNVRHTAWMPGKLPDGSGGWKAPEPAVAADAVATVAPQT